MNQDIPRQAVHFIVRGHFQSVGYRMHVRAGALSSGVAGWIRNLPTGAMEVRAEGTAAQLAHFRAALDEATGYGRIAAVEATPVACEGLAGFEIRP
jgi:acylphosphatase